MNESEITKRCTKCGDYFPLTNFRRKAAHKDGLDPWCKRCASSSRQDWYKRNAVAYNAGRQERYDPKMPKRFVPPRPLEPGEIVLSGGGIAIVDEEDFDRISQHRWRIDKDKGYAVRTSYETGRRTIVQMHRQIFDLVPGDPDRDHRDGNKLNNRKANLRPCTRVEGLLNRGPRKDNRSGFKGVYWDKQASSWEACIERNGTKRWKAGFIDPAAAARLYNEWARELFGEFAWLNPV